MEIYERVLEKSRSIKYLRISPTRIRLSGGGPNNRSKVLKRLQSSRNVAMVYRANHREGLGGSFRVD